tara:strand:- start:1768 stop:2466 length:699 start_codon:yes stop_codon:yes gene_type:complete
MNSNTYKILVVDDDPDIVELLKYNLSSDGYKVKSASNGVQAVSLAKEFIPDLTILDIMMPNMDGVETCRQIRSIPALADKFIIFLTARSEEYSEIAAFEMGADDYITKPIKPRALISRINALFRRDIKKNTGSSKINIGNLEIDRTSYTVKLDNKKIILPKKEFELLFFLAHNPNQVFSRDDLLKNIWGSDVYVLARTVDVHIRKVREKIGDGFIITIKGVGYKFVGDQLSI